ncbi:MAG: rRNA adenine dimethyltransferase family protein [Acidimicrobiales bacterium]
MREVLGSSRVDIRVADAMTFDFSTVYGADPWALVANLPYNISAPLLLDLLSTQPAMHRALVLVQREVGERLSGRAGSRTYGIPSVLTAYWGAARVVGAVPPQLFHPQPKVDSVLVRIDRWQTPPVEADYRTVRRLVRAGFGQRRKMLRRSLAEVFTSDEIESAGVESTARAETLDLAAWGRLAHVLEARSK